MRTLDHGPQTVDHASWAPYPVLPVLSAVPRALTNLQSAIRNLRSPADPVRDGAGRWPSVGRTLRPTPRPVEPTRIRRCRTSSGDYSRAPPSFTAPWPPVPGPWSMVQGLWSRSPRSRRPVVSWSLVPGVVVSGPVVLGLWSMVQGLWSRGPVVL